MPTLQTSTLTLWNVIAFLVPAGLALLAIGAAREERAEEVATTALLALAAAAVGYLACGFAFQFGGVAFVSGLPGLQSLTAEWSPLDVAWGPGWGMVGLRGFFLSAEAYNADVYFLFFSHLAAVTTAVLVALLALSGHVKRIHLLAIGLLVAGLVYPLFGNWVWGGGWLANLGLNLGLGHGFVDAGGAGAIFLLGTCVALGGFAIIRPRRVVDQGPPQLPPIHFPLFMIVGTLVAMVGWSGLLLGNPLIQESIVPAVVVMNLFLGAAGGALLTSLYSWFVTGQPNALAIGRGTVAGLVAVSAACAFIPAWAALVIGAVGGLLFLLGLYAWEQKLRLEDPSGAMATFGLPAIWGILSVALFADGRWGAGWNGVGVQQYVGVAGQGVSGWLLAKGLQPAGPGQVYAQLTGLGALLIAALLLPWLIFKTALWIYTQGLRVTTAPVPAPASAPVEGEPAAEATATEATPEERPLPASEVPTAEPFAAMPAEEPLLPAADLPAHTAEPIPHTEPVSEPREPLPEAVSAAKKRTPRPRKGRSEPS
jgi:Amt family ammonium transporter